MSKLVRIYVEIHITLKSFIIKTVQRIQSEWEKESACITSKKEEGDVDTSMNTSRIDECEQMR
jgi:hypothetical protein